MLAPKEVTKVMQNKYAAKPATAASPNSNSTPVKQQQAANTTKKLASSSPSKGGDSSDFDSASKRNRMGLKKANSINP